MYRITHQGKLMHARHSQPHTIRRWLSILGRLALIVSLWNGPIPLVHAHSADIDEAAATETFTGHLAHYHSDVTVNSHIDFGWHWHLIPKPAHHPGEESQDGPCPFCPQDSQDSQLQTQQVASPLNTATACTVTAWLSNFPEVGPRLKATASTQFLDTYLGSVSLGTLLRVARC
jgi:hypothetical protein